MTFCLPLPGAQVARRETGGSRMLCEIGPRTRLARAGCVRVRTVGAIVLAGLLLASCEAATKEPAEDTKADTTPAAPNVPPASASLPSAADTTPLRIEALPLGAVEALRRYAPTFVPFADTQYPREVLDEARQFAFHGLMVVRGDLRGVGRVDYAIAGMDGDKARVIALLNDVDGRFHAVPLTAFDSEELGSKPPRVLQLLHELCYGSCGPLEVSIIPLGGVRTRGNEVWIWSPEQRRFVMQESRD